MQLDSGGQLTDITFHRCDPAPMKSVSVPIAPGTHTFRIVVQQPAGANGVSADEGSTLVFEDLQVELAPSGVEGQKLTIPAGDVNDRVLCDADPSDPGNCRAIHPSALVCDDVSDVAGCMGGANAENLIVTRAWSADIDWAVPPGVCTPVAINQPVLEVTCHDNGIVKITYSGTHHEFDPNSGNAATTVFDKSDPTDVTITNAAPNLNPLPASIAGTVGTPLSVTGSFTDPGSLDTHTGSINWGDGSSSSAAIVEPVGATPGSAQASHSYSAPGTYTVTLTVTDDDGAPASRTTSVVVSGASTVVLSVIGQGDFESPKGAYRAAPTLSGLARIAVSCIRTTTGVSGSFGMTLGTTISYTGNVVRSVARYKNAATRCTGTGTLAGVGPVDFDVMASQVGAVDRVRVRLLNPGNGVLYDSESGAYPALPKRVVTNGDLVFVVR